MTSKVVELTNEASSKLDRCPMCGEQVSIAYPSEYPNAIVRWRTRVNCNCHLSMGWCTGDTLEECLDDAVNKWNTRAENNDRNRVLEDWKHYSNYFQNGNSLTGAKNARVEGGL